MGRMSKAEAEQAAAAARARQAVEGRVNAAEAAATEAWRQVGVTRDELKEVEWSRVFAVRRAEEAEEELRKLMAKHVFIKKIVSQTAFDIHATEIAAELQRFDASDVSKLTMLALVKVEKHHEDFSLRLKLSEQRQFAPVLKAIHAERDAAISKYLIENLFHEDAFSLLRLICKLSLRECHLIEQSFKWRHNAIGTKNRHKMMSDSDIDAPTLFNVAGIKASEQRSLAASKLELRGHEDGGGADVSGKPGGVDQAIWNGLQATGTDRTRGMATRGTEDDPHIVNISGDGAGLSDGKSGACAYSVARRSSRTLAVCVLCCMTLSCLLLSTTDTL